MKSTLTLLTALLLTQVPRAAALPAFPGAVGFGSETTHGRGGRVVAVTTLADDGPGSLRAALTATRLDTGFPPPPYEILTAAQARAAVLAGADATVPCRDFVDADLITRVKGGRYAIDMDAWSPFTEFRYRRIGMDSQLQVTGRGYFQHDFGGTPAPDSDGDGIPDAWETAHGLDAKIAGDGAKILPGGYTALEEYLNGLPSGPDEPMPARQLPNPADCLFDGGFEDGIAGWRSRACGIREHTGLAHTGQACVEVFNRKSDRRNYLQQRVINDLTRNGPGPYRAEAWVRLKPGHPATTTKLQILFLDRLARKKAEVRTVLFATATVTDKEWTRLAGSADVTWTAFAKGDGTWPGGAYFVVELEDDKAAEYFVDDYSLNRSAP